LALEHVGRPTGFGVGEIRQNLLIALEQDADRLR